MVEAGLAYPQLGSMGNVAGANRAKHGWRIEGHRQALELPVNVLWKCAGWQLQQQREICGEKDSQNETARRTPVSVAAVHVSSLCATKQLRMHTVGGASSLLPGCFPVPAMAIITDPSPSRAG